MFQDVFTHIHPIMVHFPIAIIIMATCYDLFLVIVKRKLSPRQGFWLWFVAFISALIAIGTGPDADARGNTNLFHIHVTLAYITTTLTFIVVAFRFFCIYKRKELLKSLLVVYCILSILCTVGILSVGYYGGKMVYDQGVGVKTDGKYVNPPVQGRFHHDE
ncbi:MAG TPA: DUF2231 domain-containing protein [Bacillales bacterium]|nr:DUF2231 domain-containing protein [Bacillales bacterium]